MRLLGSSIAKASAQDVGELTMGLLTLIMPLPNGGELSDMYSIATDTSLDKPELFQIFEQARWA